MCTGPPRLLSLTEKARRIGAGFSQYMKESQITLVVYTLNVNTRCCILKLTMLSQFKSKVLRWEVYINYAYKGDVHEVYMSVKQCTVNIIIWYICKSSFICELCVNKGKCTYSLNGQSMFISYTYMSDFHFKDKV